MAFGFQKTATAVIKSDGWMERDTDRQLDRWAGRRAGGQAGGQAGEWADIQTDGWTDTNNKQKPNNKHDFYPRSRWWGAGA
jgi:hypothetical protein